jgi:hypothetical protein
VSGYNLGKRSGEIRGNMLGYGSGSDSGEASGNTLGYSSGSDSSKEAGTISDKNSSKRSGKKLGKELLGRVKTRVRRSGKTKTCKARGLLCLG